MKKITLFSSFIFFIFSCQRASEIAIPPGEVTEVLTQSGKENPETNIVIHVKDYGNIHLRLYKETPLHRANFIRLIKAGHFESGKFYRIISDFMIQGGNQSVKEQKFTVPAELSLQFTHKKGALAMARRDENNPEKRSSATEFFIIRGRPYTQESLQDAVRESGRKWEDYSPEQVKTYLQTGGDARMDDRYTVFGEVIQGLEVVEKIADVKIYEGEKPVEKIAFTIEITQR
jgi:peptidyl-prolyl cis-trans isomerase B (cyclophilin B)